MQPCRLQHQSECRRHACRYRKQKRPAEAGRFELTKLNEPGSLIVNRSRGGQHAYAGGGGIASTRSSHRILSPSADGILEQCRIRPTSSLGLAHSIDRCVPAFFYRDETSRTVWRVARVECRVVNVVLAGAKDRSRGIRVLDQPNFQRRCPASAA